MQYLELKDFRRSINNLWKHGGRHQKAAERIQAILGRLGTDLDPFEGVRETKHGESRIRNCIKYDLNDHCRLLTIQTAKECVFLTCGSHAEVDRWLESRRGFVPVVNDCRVIATYASGTAEGETFVLEAGGHYAGPLRERLPEEMFDQLVAGLPRRVARAIEDIEATVEESELKQITGQIENETQRLAVFDVMALLRQDRLVEAVARFKLFTGELVPLEEAELPEIIDSDIIKVIDPKSPRFAEALSRFMKTARYRDWMVFMHPDQQAVVDEDFPGAAKLVGVSGSGKTCVVVQRAIRLALKYPGQRILVLTLNRALAALIEDLITACAPDEAIGQIDVRPLFVLCQEIMREFDPNADRTLREVTWKGGEHVDEIWQEYYHCENNNDDAKVFEPVHDSLLARGWHAERYLRQEIDWLRSAVRPADREQYRQLRRKGRTVNLPTHFRDLILAGTLGWEEKMQIVGVIDALGIAQMLSDYLEQIGPRYRCVLVDEVQDFGNLELSLVRALAERGENDLFLCGDAAQAVTYKHWNLDECGIEIPRGSSRQLTLNYRNSRDVLQASFAVLQKNLGTEMPDRDGLHILDPEYSAVSGSTPVLLGADSLAEELRFAIATCRERVSEAVERKACVAVCGFSLYEISKYGERIGVPVLDGSTDINQDSVFLSDLEQTKGFEFDIVIVVNASAQVVPQPAAPSEERFRDLSRLYVAMTRAKTELIVSYAGEPSPFIAAAKGAFYSATWAEYQADMGELLAEVPMTLDKLRDDRPTRSFRHMSGGEFLRSSAAVGVSVELSAKLRELVDGRGLRKGNERLKWRDLGAAWVDFSQSARSRLLWGPEGSKEFEELGRRLDLTVEQQAQTLESPTVPTAGEPITSASDGESATRIRLAEGGVLDQPAHPQREMGKDGFNPVADKSLFSPAEWKQLLRYGKRYSDLSMGIVSPTDDDQAAFARLFRGQESREPVNAHERLWLKYLVALREADGDRPGPLET